MNQNKLKIMEEHKAKLIKMQQNNKINDDLLNFEYKILNDEEFLNKIIREISTKQDYNKIINVSNILKKIELDLTKQINDLLEKKNMIKNSIVLLNDSLNDYSYGIGLNINDVDKFLDIEYEKIENGKNYNILVHIKVKDKHKIHIKDESNRLLILRIINEKNTELNCNIQYDINKIDTDTNVVIGNYYITR